MYFSKTQNYALFIDCAQVFNFQEENEIENGLKNLENGCVIGFLIKVALNLINKLALELFVCLLYIF